LVETARIADDSQVWEVYDAYSEELIEEIEEDESEEVGEPADAANEDIERLANQLASRHYVDVAPQQARTYSPPPEFRNRAVRSHWFRVGDLVQYEEPGMDHVYFAAIGRVLQYGSFGRYLIEFDRPIPNGHNGKGAGTPGCCKWFYRKQLILFEMRNDDAEGERVVRPAIEPPPLPPQVKRKLEQDRLAQEKLAMSYAPGVRVAVQFNPEDNRSLAGYTGRVICKNGKYVMVELDKPISKGHSGNGRGKKGHCWNLHIKYLQILKSGNFYVKEDYKRGGKNLKGQKVKVLARIIGPDKEFSIVEFTESVPQGHSADGKGKKEHCLTVPSDILELKHEEKQDEKVKAEKK
jgi:hypothetical protein